MFQASWRQALEAWEKFQKILMIFIWSFVTEIGIVFAIWQNFITFFVNFEGWGSPSGCLWLGQNKRLLLYPGGGT